MDNLTALLDQQVRTIVSFLPSLVAAILILIVGYIIAKLVAAAIRGLLRRTTLDNRIANAIAAVSGGKGGGRPHYASAGAGDVSKLPLARARAVEIVRGLLGR